MMSTMAPLKKAFRKTHLKRLREWATAEPAQLHDASLQLCDHLYHYIQSRYRPTLPLRGGSTHGTNNASRGTSPSRLPITTTTTTTTTTPLLIFTYLPLYYEVDLVPLMRWLWPTAQEQRIHLFTPVVLPPSTDRTAGEADPHRDAMVFVEVLDEADLERFFAPQGSLNIRELSSGVLALWLMGPLASSQLPTTTEGRREGQQHDVPAMEPRGEPGGKERVRHVVLCDSYARLFPAAHAAGYRPVGLLEYTCEATALGGMAVRASAAAPPSRTLRHLSEVEGGGESLFLDDAAMLVLAPGVAFDVQTGHRIGKGGGYYDRFLAYHASHHARGKAHRPTLPAASASAPELPNVTASTDWASEAYKGNENGGGGGVEGTPLWEVVAVAFDSQVMHSSPASTPQGGVRFGAASPLPETIPIDAHDQLVHSVVSPSGGVEAVWAQQP